MELEYIACMVATGSLESLKKSGITVEDLIDPDAIKLLKYITDTARHNDGRPASKQTLAKVYPDIVLPEAFESAEFYAQAVMEQRDTRQIVQALLAARTMQQGGVLKPSELVDRIVEEFKSIEIKSRDLSGLSVVENAGSVLEDYNERAEGGGLVGAPYPWSALSEATHGMQKGEFNILAGRPKRFKTWLLLFTADFLHKELGFRVTIFTKELTEEQIMMRVVALRAGVDWDKFLAGKLNDAEYAKLEKQKAHWDVQEAYDVVRIRAVNGDAIMEMESYIEKLKPDFVAIDGLNLFANSWQWEEMTKLSRNLKQMFLNGDYVSLCTTQLKQPPQGKKKIVVDEENSIAYSDAFLQDCDNFMSIRKNSDDEAVRQVVISLPAARNNMGAKLSINTKPAFDFFQKRDLSKEQDDFDAVYEKEANRADKLVS